MTLADKFKILDKNIKANKAQYDLHREAAKIFALSSGELEKYEYLTGEDLVYKSDVIQKAKFEDSPLAKIFHKGLDASDKKRTFEKVENIEVKNKKKLDEIEYQGERQLDATEKQRKNNLEVIDTQEKQLKKSRIKKN